MFRRTSAIVATSAVIALAAIAPAKAEAPQVQTYAAGASGTALEITLAGQNLSFSATSAGVASTPDAGATAEANGAAALLAGTPVPGDALSKAPEGPGTNEACPGALDLNEASGGQLSLLGLEIACTRTAASNADGSPSATSESGEVKLVIRAPGGTLLEPVLTQLFAALPQATGPLLDALAPLLDPLGEVSGIAVDDIVNDLLDGLADDMFVLAEIVVAPSYSEAGANAADGIFARAGSNGVTINLLPGVTSTIQALVGLEENIGQPDTDPGTPVDPADEDAEPLVQLKLGVANAQVVRDPATGEVKPDASASQPIALNVNDDLGVLALITGQINDQANGFAIDQLACDAANPLADVICFEAGLVKELTAEELTARGYDFGAGTVGREATAANLQILGIAAEQLGGAVIGISFAGADAAVNAVVPAVAPPAAQPPAPGSPSLPRTGTDSALPLTLGLLAVGAAGAALLRRTRTTV
jgi:LPXTG-motif cell wall-anchored protein